MDRGRSRQVSQTAIARNAAMSPSSSSSPPSYPSSSSSSPSSSMSPDYDYDESPSPPQTLEDQVYIAYADDNMHLARVLLLRLKGIEVTGDNDPRIAEVRDEDFDYCFAPHGGLTLDEESEKALLERQRIEQQKVEERRRMERLWTREQKWASEKRRMREERTRVLREQEQRRAEDEQRQRRRAHDQRATRVRHQPEARVFQLRGANDRPRQIVSYTSRRRQGHNSSDTDSDDDSPSPLLLHDFMIVPQIPRSLRRHQPTSPLAPSTSNPRHTHTPTFDDSCSISFTEVIASMNGPLFPVTDEERRRTAQSPISTKLRSRSRSKGPGRSHSQIRRRKQADLFQSLLIAPSSTEEERRRSRKGKAKAVATPRGSSGRCSECRRSPSSSSSSSSELPSPTASTSSSVNSRPSSWLSFGSTATTSSIATTPSSSPSPRSSWLKSVPATIPSPTSPSRRSSWLGTTLVSPPLPIERRNRFEERRCTCHQSHLIPIHLSDSPLAFEDPLAVPIVAPPTKPYSTSLESIRTRKRSKSVSGPTLAGSLLGNVSAGVSSLVGFAKGFQQAYVAAAMFSVAASCDGDRWEERQVSYEYDRERGVRVVRVAGDVYTTRVRKEDLKKKSSMKPPGRRVSPKDVATFLDVKLTCSCACVSATSKASLDFADQGEMGQQKDAVAESCVHRVKEAKKYYDIPLGNPHAPAPSPPSTVLPNPLPYNIHFKPIPTPSRSPFRFNAFSHLHTTYPEQESVVENALLSACSSGTVRGISWRIRSVNNPVYLRLRALQNVVVNKGIQWEGRGREMSMGGGRDRMVGVAYDGMGSSKLSRGPVLVGRR